MASINFTLGTNVPAQQINGGADFDGATYITGVSSGVRQFLRSTDRVNWVSLHPIAVGLDNEFEAGIANGFMAKSADALFVAGEIDDGLTTKGVCRSDDNGLTWAWLADSALTVVTGFLSHGVVAAYGNLVVLSPHHTVTTAGFGRYTTNGGDTWANTTIPLEYIYGAVPGFAGVMLFGQYRDEFNSLSAMAAYTTNGADWTQVELPTFYQYITRNSVGLLLGVSTAGANEIEFGTSVDYINWTTHPNVQAEYAPYISALSYNGTAFVFTTPGDYDSITPKYYVYREGLVTGQGEISNNVEVEILYLGTYDSSFVGFNYFGTNLALFESETFVGEFIADNFWTGLIKCGASL